MVSKRVLLGLSTLLLFVLVAFVLYPKTGSLIAPSSKQPETPMESTLASKREQAEPTARVPPQLSDAIAVSDNDAKPTSAIVAVTNYTIHGQIHDEYNRPLADVLVSDELEFGSVRSDADGRYQITVRRPKFKTPLLNFLRDGYRENRIGIAIHNTPDQSLYEVNVTLRATDDSTDIEGWIGNDLGEGLGGRTIRLRVQAGQGDGNTFYAVISNRDGDFWFEGIRSGVAYKLEVEPSKNYAGYTLEPFDVTQQTPRSTIILERVKLVDIEGLIVGTDYAPIANHRFNVQNLSLDYPDRQIASDSSGFFALKDFPTGKLKFSTKAAEYFKISGVNLQAHNYRNLMLVIDKGSYFLSGWISDENGAPLANARITLNSRFNRDGFESFSQRSIITDTSGEFQFNHLGNVEHTLSIHASGFPNRTISHRFKTFSDRLEIRLSN